MNGTCQDTVVNGTVGAGEEKQGAERTGRDERGRFAKGNRGGPGNPFARRTAEIMEAFRATATPEALKELGLVMLGRALAGDMTAAKLYLQYAVGKPRDMVDPDRLDQNEWETVKGKAAPLDALETIERVPVRFVCELAGPLMEVQEVAVREKLRMEGERDQARQRRRAERGKKPSRVRRAVEDWIAGWVKKEEPRTEHGPNTEKNKESRREEERGRNEGGGPLGNGIGTGGGPLPIGMGTGGGPLPDGMRTGGGPSGNGFAVGGGGGGGPSGNGVDGGVGH